MFENLYYELDFVAKVSVCQFIDWNFSRNISFPNFASNKLKLNDNFVCKFRSGKLKPETNVEIEIRTSFPKFDPAS